MIRFLLLLLIPSAAAAKETFRIATFNTELSREGPGLLLRDIQKGRDPQISAVISVVTAIDPDILILQGLDWDLENRALLALSGAFEQSGSSYGFSFSAQPNSGIATTLDLDGDGRRGQPQDAQGFGRFTGQGGIGVLSKFPIDQSAIENFTDMLWRDVPDAVLPIVADEPFPSEDAQEIQRLSSTAHWVLPILLPDGPMHLMTYQAGPPVFDGPEDRNGLRNRDENRFWLSFLDGKFGLPPTDRFVIAGGSNLDPYDSDGHGEVMLDLLNDVRLQDPKPASLGAASTDGQSHVSANELDTVDWPNVGRLRVDYILPSQDWEIVEAGVYWPTSDQSGHHEALQASRHRLVWVDLKAP